MKAIELRALPVLQSQSTTSYSTLVCGLQI
uniref:Uncharacterized protein n=1 Tax=Amphimedon queenslandica TaxID=400682 RepID=A0A1X7V2E6_AMPQE